jgi:predicted lysophospholipase L1 biosynthesis ABC-type transport system permease subunit
MAAWSIAFSSSNPDGNKERLFGFLTGDINVSGGLSPPLLAAAATFFRAVSAALINPADSLGAVPPTSLFDSCRTAVSLFALFAAVVASPTPPDPRSSN